MEDFEKRNDEIIENVIGEQVEEDEYLEEQDKSSNWKRELWEWTKTIIYALVISLVLKSYVLTLAKVDGQSMEPTLHHADRLYVNKLFYTPKKGDVVVVESNDPSAPFYIKRVIATEGDTLFINFATGDVYVNDEIIDEPYIAGNTRLVGSYIYDLILDNEFSRENPLVIGEDEVFVMGDNRNNSKDSREIGPIKAEDVVGHAVFRFWPLDNMGNTDYSFEE